jgi:hypothetical protein
LDQALLLKPPEERLDLGCALRHGAFEVSDSSIHFSQPDEALICFFLSFLRRLQQLGTAPAIDLAEYSRALSLCALGNENKS